MAAQAADSGMWGGSLLTVLGKIVCSAKSELILCSPYWRESGVASLLSAAGRSGYDGLDVLVHDGPLMKDEDRQGLGYLIRRMRTIGAKLRMITPLGVQGWRPFPHATLVIADGSCAYVGSANFTLSGLDHAIEAGLIVDSQWEETYLRGHLMERLDRTGFLDTPPWVFVAREFHSAHV